MGNAYRSEMKTSEMMHSWLFLASSILGITHVSPGSIGTQIPNHTTVYACPHDRAGLVGSVYATRSAITDAEAPVLSYARFTPDGGIIGVDRLASRVFLFDEDLTLIRIIGREGPGPGEYQDPVAAVADDVGRVFVTDATGPSMIVYQEDGVFVREDPLPINFSPYGLAADGALAYATGRVLFHTIPAPPRPVLVEYDPNTGGSRVLLRQTPEWFGRPPVYRNGVLELIPQVGPQGDLYIGFIQGYEIWRIIGPDEYEVVVRGCIPEGALRAFLAEDDGTPTNLPMPSSVALSVRSPRVSYNLLGDFVVLPGERILSRGILYVDEGGARSLDLFALDGDGGRLMASWSLGPEEVLEAWTTINPNAPTQHLTWAPYDGTTSLLRFSDISLVTQSGPTMDARPPFVALLTMVVVGGGVLFLVWLTVIVRRNVTP